MLEIAQAHQEAEARAQKAEAQARTEALAREQAEARAQEAEEQIRQLQAMLSKANLE
jgi:hypothetical protein